MEHNASDNALPLLKPDMVRMSSSLLNPFILLVSETSRGMALTTLSTMVMEADRAVLDRGFRSIVMTVFPIRLRAYVLSPSSKGTSTVSAAPIVPVLSVISLPLA